MNVLVTGGAGYIGSHTVIELLLAGHRPIVADALTNSSAEVVGRIKQITGADFPLHVVDCTSRPSLAAVFKEHHIDAVMHFAGLKAVGESVTNPLLYYRMNLDIALTLLEVMREAEIRKLVFSSSCTVYGEPEELPLRETSRAGVGITSPYGWTKFVQEQIYRDLAAADPAWAITILRYFNPVGAHESGLIGEDPLGIPANILPYVAQVAAGKLDKVKVFGHDYNTPDGTGVRDYIHVVDLARGHVAALDRLTAGGVSIYNLGTGRGVSVLELIRAFEQASGTRIPHEFVARRPGDVAITYADVSKANRELGWRAERTVEDACRDAWRWQSRYIAASPV